MKTIRSGNTTQVFLTDKEFKVYEKIYDYKSLGLPMKQLMNELKEKYTASQISVGIKAYNMWKSGAEISKSGGYDEPNVHPQTGYWATAKLRLDN